MEIRNGSMTEARKNGLNIILYGGWAVVSSKSFPDRSNPRALPSRYISCGGVFS